MKEVKKQPEQSHKTSATGPTILDLKNLEKLHSVGLKSKPLHLDSHHDILTQIITLEHEIRSPLERMSILQKAVKRQNLHLRNHRIEFASLLMDLAKKCYDLDRYDESLAMYKEILRIARDTFAAGHSHIVDSLTNLAGVYGAMHRYEDSLSAAEESLLIQRKSLHDQHPNLAAALSNLGATCIRLNQPLRAVGMLEEALQIYIAETPKDEPKIALCYNNLGIAYFELRNYEDALDRHNQALLRRRSSLPKLHLDIAQSLHNLGNTYYKLRQQDEAVNAFTAALHIYRQILPADHPTTAETYVNLGIILFEARRFEEALDIHLEVLRTRRKTLPEEHPDIAQSLNNLAGIYMNLRRFEEAREAAEGALRIWSSLPQDHPDLGLVRSNLSIIYSHLRLFDAALDSVQESLRIRRAVLPEDHPDIASSLGNLAETYRKLGRFEEAVEAAEEASRIDRAAHPPEHPTIAESLNTLANAYQDTQRDEDAVAAGIEALHIRRTSLPEYHPLIASSLDGLARAYSRLEQFQAAVWAGEEAASIQRVSLPENHPDTAATLNNLASIYLQVGRIEEAEQLFEEAVNIHRISLPEQHPEVSAGLSNLARMHHNSSRPVSSVSLISKSLLIQLHEDQFPLSSKGIRAKSSDRQHRLHNDLAFLLDTLPRLKNHMPEASDGITALLTYKGNVDIEQSLASILYAKAQGSFRSLLEERLSLQAQLARLRYSDKPQDLPQYVQLLNRLKLLEKQLETHPQGRQLADELRLRMITAENVRAVLRPQEALLNFIVLGDQVHAQILHQDNHHIHTYRESPKAHVKKLRALLAGEGQQFLELHNPILQSELQSLYGMLISPIKNELRIGIGLESLVISADGYLYGLPWDLLCDAEAEENKNRIPTTLLHEVSVRSIPTPRDLVRLHHLAELYGENQNPALLLGVQSFQQDGEDSAEKNNGRSPQSFTTRAEVFVAGAESELPLYLNLPGTRNEVLNLAKLLERHGKDTIMYLSPTASEEILLNSTFSPSVLHLSTHSDVWDEADTAVLYQQNLDRQLEPRFDPAHPFSQAVVLLDGYTGKNFHGVLRAWELASLNLQSTELVTFSSCNSGLGWMEAGRGVVGLSQAAFLAGAQRTITTLWPVLDQTTSEWMENVYAGRLQGLSWQEAVRQEKLRMLEDEYPLQAWAPFVLNGLA
ncbi:CHAT domain-containing protein (plasmid) [Deinococcus psychrotolerans]|uniref:CHAT domain-containing protein n=1 Tax=Deinococcus psychrotolerans TaxID=2489213 RepID=A0A3G8YJ15_9DEIO|nr:CHAT domain-containing tetratricopeptide repeat protein [Deinococcus psychrotolerans]AZI45249.1 CHAT domain-containing protein [Deinococcus psychrotolerans]